MQVVPDDHYKLVIASLVGLDEQWAGSEFYREKVGILPDSWRKSVRSDDVRSKPHVWPCLGGQIFFGLGFNSVILARAHKEMRELGLTTARKPEELTVCELHQYAVQMTQVAQAA